MPKLPVDTAVVTELGFTGDAHRFADHGGPRRALCLYSLELIAALRAEGHPIAPGTTGENITIAGLAWRDLEPGARLALGPEVVAEITEPAPPCRVIQASFADRRFGRIGEAKYPGWSRLYARVLRAGTLRVGHGVVRATTAARDLAASAP